VTLLFHDTGRLLVQAWARPINPFISAKEPYISTKQL